MTPRERRHIGVVFAAKNKLDYKEVHNFLFGNQDPDEERLNERLMRRFVNPYFKREV